MDQFWGDSLRQKLIETGSSAVLKRQGVDTRGAPLSLALPQERMHLFAAGLRVPSASFEALEKTRHGSAHGGRFDIATFRVAGERKPLPV